MIAAVDGLLATERPDAVLVLGDTNSALCTIVAARYGIPVFHMEAGNRCLDPVVPEELNRHVIDSVSTFNLPYTETSRDNLLREGMPQNRIWVSGNPIYEVLAKHQDTIDASPILNQLGLEQDSYLLVTAHRAENMDQPARLASVMAALERIAER